MPDLTGLPALDVAIGLSFVFLLLSLVASAVQELLANLFSLRARTLELGLRNMLVETTAAPPGSDAATQGAADAPPADLLVRVYTHPLIRSLYRESRSRLARTTLSSDADTAVQTVKDVRLPSYIAPRAFGLALLDTLAPALTLTSPDGRPRESHDVIRELRDAILGLGIPPGVKHRLLTLLDEARGDVDAFRLNLEAWFDDTMARVSGWYKRKTQLFLILIAIPLTVALNANTLTMGERMWRDPALRSAVVQKAGTVKGNVDNAVTNVESIRQLGVPLGWSQKADDPRRIDLGNWGWAHWLGGWLLTIFAVALGAPFWFDTLGRLSRLRGTGKPESPLPATGRGQPGERVVTPPPARS